MRTVRDDSGKHLLLVKESAESSLVRDPETGEQRYVENATLSQAGGKSPLSVAAQAVPEGARRLLTAVPDERALGLLVELDARGPLPVRELLGTYDLCESDVHGLLAEFRVAGLVEEQDVAGERGYAATDATADALDAVID